MAKTKQSKSSAKAKKTKELWLLAVEQGFLMF